MNAFMYVCTYAWFVNSLTWEQYQLWRDHPHAITWFLSKLPERQHSEMDAWLILREALIERRYTTEYVRLQGDEWIMNSCTISAWSKRT